MNIRGNSTSLGAQDAQFTIFRAARMTESYIDYIVRYHPEDFAQIGFIGKPYHNVNAKW